MKYMKRLSTLFMSCIVVLSGCGGQASSKLTPESPVVITVWHYYNGSQQAEFSEFISEFNKTLGAKKGIQVKELSQSSINDLSDNILASARKEVGAEPLPNIFSAYADTAYAADQLGVVADISDFFTEEELDLYISDYLEEGYLFNESGLKIFPVAKSTEIMMINKTDWERFAKACGASISALSTIEGVTGTAEQYYHWTDGLTPDIPNDGKALFGRDAFANYMLIGARQLGTEIFEVTDGICTLHFDKAVMHKLWDNHYVPMVAGWFCATNRFRSDDIKMGNIIACVCSTSGASYFPDSVLTSDTESYPIDFEVLAVPEFKNGEKYAVQQGAGMVVTQADEKEIYASVEFLKWFTEASRNFSFSINSGYLPVTKEANTTDYLAQTTLEIDAKMRSALTMGIQVTQQNHMYTPRAFENGTSARSILDTSMPDAAERDRTAFLELLDSGIPYDQALAQFRTEENFNQWYEETLTELNALIGRK